MKRLIGLLSVLAGNVSPASIILDRPAWWSSGGRVDPVTLSSSSLPSGLNPTSEAIVFDNGIELSPNGEVIFQNGYSGVFVNFNNGGVFTSSQSYVLSFPESIFGLSFFLGNGGTSYEDVAISLATPGTADSISLGYFPEQRQQFVGFRSSEPFSGIEVRFDAVPFEGQLGNTTLYSSDFAQIVPEPSVSHLLGCLVPVTLLSRRRR